MFEKHAYEQDAPSAILTYLDLKKDAFYSVENTVDGKHFVTAKRERFKSDHVSE